AKQVIGCPLIAPAGTSAPEYAGPGLGETSGQIARRPGVAARRLARALDQPRQTLRGYRAPRRGRTIAGTPRRGPESRRRAAARWRPIQTAAARARPAAGPPTCRCPPARRETRACGIQPTKRFRAPASRADRARASPPASLRLRLDARVRQSGVDRRARARGPDATAPASGDRRPRAAPEAIQR